MRIYFHRIISKSGSKIERLINFKYQKYYIFQNNKINTKIMTSSLNCGIQNIQSETKVWKRLIIWEMGSPSCTKFGISLFLDKKNPD